MRIPRKFMMSPLHDKFGGVYHLVSRIVWREFIFGDAEREEFVKLMRKYEAFSDIKVLGYCIMSNHVHIMAYVPPARPEELSDGQFLKQLRYLYNGEHIDFVKNQLDRATYSVR
jgi:REP element-mobilizing transposase RayT